MTRLAQRFEHNSSFVAPLFKLIVRLGGRLWRGNRGHHWNQNNPFSSRWTTLERRMISMYVRRGYAPLKFKVVINCWPPLRHAMVSKCCDGWGGRSRGRWPSRPRWDRTSRPKFFELKNLKTVHAGWGKDSPLVSLFTSLFASGIFLFYCVWLYLTQVCSKFQLH